MNASKHSLAWTLLALSAAASNAVAQEAPAPEAERPPLYRIELIVFAYNEADPGEELFRAEAVTAPEAQIEAIDLLDPATALATFDFESASNLDVEQLTAQPAELAGNGDAAADQLPADAIDPADTGESADPNAPTVLPGQSTLGEAEQIQDPRFVLEQHAGVPFAFRLLDRSELELNAEYARLQRVDAYTPLMHGGWIQEGLPQNEALPFNLAYLGTLNPQGTLELYVSRFVHVILDIDYRPESGSAAAPPATPRPTPQTVGEGGAAFSLTDPLNEPVEQPLDELRLGAYFPLETDRLVRSGELHYFDHPYFGVLVKVEPFEPEPEVADGAGPAA